jgi:hypothetical protein
MGGGHPDPLSPSLARNFAGWQSRHPTRALCPPPRLPRHNTERTEHLSVLRVVSFQATEHTEKSSCPENKHLRPSIAGASAAPGLFCGMNRLLRPVGSGHFTKDERIKDGQDVLAIAQYALDHGLGGRIAMRLPLPPFEHMRRHIDIRPQFLERLAA